MMERWSVVVLALVVGGPVVVVSGQTTNVQQCTVFGGERPLNIYIEGCENPPCLLPQLEVTVITIVFRAPHTMTSMRTLATAFLGFVPIPYNLGDDAETCNFLTNSFCPVIEGEVIQYRLNMFIESFMPVGTSTTVEFRVVDETNSPFLCVRMPIRITEPRNRLSAGNRTESVH